MFALIDSNNFYASCEENFNPKLEGKPIVVLSNNDGNVVSRSASAKLLGIPMGEPYFKIKPLIEKHGIAVFSSNYELYGSLSRRVMNLLSTFTPEIEIYSIDEAFLSLDGFSSLTGGRYDLHSYAKEIRQTVLKGVGINTCVGIAPTKTLAKVANRIAKKNPSLEGVLVLDTAAKREAALRQIEVSDIWGIGRQYSAKLQQAEITNGWQLANQPVEWARKNLGGVVGMRLIQELRGIACIQLELFPAHKQTIACTRSFGKPVTSLDHLTEAISSYTTTAAEKLRKQHSCVNILTVFIHTSHFNSSGESYGASTNVTLPTASDHTGELIHYALKGLKSIYKPGPIYRKAGIILNGIVHNQQIQTNLFDTLDRDKGNRLMNAMDKVNEKLGKNTLGFASSGSSKKKKSWEMLSEKRSPRYTTRIEELPIVKAN